MTTDNDVYVEFHSDVCFVKDKLSRKVMLHDILKDGLYQLELPSIQSPCPTVSSTSLPVAVSPNKSSACSAPVSNSSCSVVYLAKCAKSNLESRLL